MARPRRAALLVGVLGPALVRSLSIPGGATGHIAPDDHPWWWKNQKCTGFRMPEFDATAAAGQRFARGQQAWVLIRGAAWRASPELQRDALCTLRQRVLRPLKEHFSASLRVHLCLRPDPRNAELLRQLRAQDAGDTVSLREVDFQAAPTRLGQWRACLDDVPDNAGMVLNLRPDLYWLQDANFTGADRMDRVYFQWNLFHHCRRREMPDQVHLVGGQQVGRFKRWLQRTHVDTPTDPQGIGDGGDWTDTGHNLYNWAAREFGQDKLGYLNFYPESNCYTGKAHNISAGSCIQRGNSERGWNPFFVYDRTLRPEQADAHACH